MGGKFHTTDAIEGRLGELQDQMEKQARLNAVTAANVAIQQLQLIALQQAVQLEKEQIEALTFLFNQQTQRIARYEFIQKAVEKASNEYLGILLSESHKPLNLSLLFTFIGLAVVPEYMALSGACKILADKWDDALKILEKTLKSIGKSIDAGKYASGSGGKDRRGVFGVVNQVIEAVYGRILEDEAAVGDVVQAFKDAILQVEPRPLQFVQDYWRQANLQILQSAGFVAAQTYSNLLRDIILYDMLRAYTSRYVVITFDRMPLGVSMAGFPNTGVMLDSARLKDIPNGIVNVKGLSDEQREMIYTRFSEVSWQDQSRRPVNSWRDLVSNWGAEVPGFQTDRRVDARFIGR